MSGATVLIVWAIIFTSITASSKMFSPRQCIILTNLSSFVASQRPTRRQFRRSQHVRNSTKGKAIASFSDDNCSIMNAMPSGGDAPAIGTLVHRAQFLREKLFGDSHSLPSFLSDSKQLAYPSSTYKMETTGIKTRKNYSVQRGFCNWLLPRKIMIGQYPGMTPESNGPSLKECHGHIQNMVKDVKISMFCCLQTEVPSQDDDLGWGCVRSCVQKELRIDDTADGDGLGKVYLEPLSLRREFPRPFTRYGPLVQSMTDSPIIFLHNPIEDLSVPACNDALLYFLSQLLKHLEKNNDNVVYIHCWGGRGRAGLIGSCLASLLFPELSSKAILDWVQSGYDTRLGAKFMPEELKKSPQTEQQRWFVKEFVGLVQAERYGK